MMSLHMGAAGSPAAAQAMAAYLLESQIPDQALRAAAYYGQTAGTEEALSAGHGAAPTLRADIAPELAEALGFTPGQVVDADSLGHILAGRRADGEALPVQMQNRDVTSYGSAEDGDGKVRHRVAYLDLTLSAPKSLSVAWAFAETEAERNSLLQAHRTAKDETLRYVEEQIVRARLGSGGRDGTEPARAAWITVDHFTARPTQEATRTDPTTGEVFTELRSLRVAGDPALHSHSLVPNLVATESGRFASMDTAAFHGRIHEFGAVYQAVLGRELRAIGVEVDLDPRTNMARLPAIPEHVVEEFSKRSREGEKAARALAASEGREWDSMTPEQQAAFNKAGTHNTRQDKETNTPDMDAWREQAARIGWQHRSVVTGTAPARDRAERMDHADREGLPHLADMLSKRAVIGQGEARLAAARGFIAAGIEGTDDIGSMMKRWAAGGVRQDGQWTKLLWKEVERGTVRMTTELHRDQEAELIALAQRAVADRSHALAPAEVAAAVARSDVSFRGEHGEVQRATVETLGTDGGLAVMIGAAGVGKTKAVLPPLVAAWQERGLEVWGVAQAWRQAKELEEAGIGHFHTRALQPFLDGVHEGRTPLGRDNVVVLDELGQIGTRQLLDLLRLREERGFKLVAMGDDKQAQSIEAGPVIDLLRRAIGEGRIPQILTTVRQLTEEERAIAGLFRDGKVATAIDVKREAGTAELVPGGYRDAVERVADLYEQRRRATQGQAGYRITISAPINVDAREISRAVRERRRGMGEVGPDMMSLSATDGRGTGYTMDLAVGDKVRLFARTRGVFTDDKGRRKSASVGDNGSVLVVEKIDRHEGLTLRTDSGKVAFVSWAALQDKAGSGRPLLAHGDVLTIDSSQGITSDEHINALPSGSAAVSGFKGYVAESRHRVRSYMVGSMGAEMRQARTRRMSGLPPLTPQEEAREGWANLVRNLEKRPEKDSALVFLERAAATKRQAVKVLQGTLRRHEDRTADGKSPTTVQETAMAREVRKAAPEIVESVATLARQQAAAAERMATVLPPVPASQTAQEAPPAPAGERPVAAATPQAETASIEAVSQGTAAPSAQRPARRVKITELEAQQQFLDAMRLHGLRPKGLPIMDGTLRYVPVEGNKGREVSGAYKGFFDEGRPAGAIYNYKQGGFITAWKADGEAVSMSASEQAAPVSVKGVAARVS
jgi:conjugative relaxase-like TrwC/TraI family protein